MINCVRFKADKSFQRQSVGGDLDFDGKSKCVYYTVASPLMRAIRLHLVKWLAINVKRQEGDFYVCLTNHFLRRIHI